MKSFVMISLLWVTTSSFVFAPPKVKDYALLTFKVVKHKSVEASIQDSYYFVDIIGGNAFPIMVNSNGIFIDTIRADHPYNKTKTKFINIHYGISEKVSGTIPIYFKNNEDVTVIFKITKTGNAEISFKGKYAKECDYLYSNSIKVQADSRFYPEFKTAFSARYRLSGREYLDKIRDLKNELIQMAKKAKLSTEFKKIALKRINYWYYSDMLEYELTQLMFEAEGNRNPPYFPKFADDPGLDKNNLNDYLTISDYQFLLHELLIGKVYKNVKLKVTPDRMGFVYPDYTRKMFKAIPKFQLHEVIKNDFLYQTLKDSLMHFEGEKKHELYKEFMQLSTNEKHKEDITDIIKQ